MYDFSRRFTIDNPSFAAAIAAANPITDLVLQTNPAFLSVVRVVRSYSILLGNLKFTEIYSAITNDADAEIGLLLLSAQNADGSQRYTLAQVEAMLWGTPIIAGFSDYKQGLLEVSCKFAAAIFIGAFATQQYQYNTAEFLRKQAIETLDRLIALQTRTATGTSAIADTSDSARFYFESKTITLGADLAVSFFLPNAVAAADWILAKTYLRGETISTKTIAADIALAINRYTLNPSASTNIIAAVSQSGQGGLPYIDFAMRDFNVGINCDLVSVQFTDAASASQLPFSWGLEVADLNPTFVNSCLLLQRSPKATTLSTITSASRAGLPTDYSVLYFRLKQGTLTSTAGDLTYRLSVTESSVRTASPGSTVGSPRYSQMAVSLMNGLQSFTGQTRLLGAIVRDDPISNANAMSAIQLIAWSVLSPTTYLVLDILTVPDDIEIALGDKYAPQTAFSQLPLTVICKPLYERALGSNTTAAASNANFTAELGQLGARTNRLTDSIRQQTELITGYQYN